MTRARKAAASGACATEGQTVDQFVACMNKTYALSWPRQSDFPTQSPMWELYGLPIKSFADQPGYLYWAEIDKPWTLVTEPKPIGGTVAEVWAKGDAT